MKTKTCGKCGLEKKIIEFYKNKTYKDGVSYYCKDCCKLYYIKNKKRYDILNNEYYISHKKERNKYNKNHHRQNREKILKRKRKYYQSHKIERTKYEKDKRKSDINYKIIGILRGRLRSALKRNSKSASTKKLLGCTIPELKKYLVKQFTPGMTWKNHSFKGWHIDHIRPCASFDLSKPSEQRKCFHYTNLQPLWAIDNYKKGNQYPR